MNTRPDLRNLPHFEWKPTENEVKKTQITDILRGYQKIIPQYIAEFIQSKYQFVFNKNRLWMYDKDKGVWILADEHIIENRIMDFILDRYSYIEKIPDKSTPDTIISVRRLTENIVKEYHAVEDIKKPYDRFLNLQNVMFDPFTGYTYHHDRQYYSFSQLPFKFDEKADCPMFKEFIEYTMDNNQESIELMRRFMAYVISDITSLQYYVHIIGATGTGKSRMAAMMLNLIGLDKSTTLSLSNTNDTFFLADIPGKKFILINELDEAYLDSKTESLLKNITSFDPIVVRKSYKDPKTVNIEAKTMICSNNFPSMHDASRALQRRLLLFEWNKRINTVQGNKWFGTTNDFKTELSGIFNWLMPAYREIFERGSQAFERNEVMLHSINEIIADSNQIVSWVEEKATITEKSEDWEFVENLHNDYYEWKVEIKSKTQTILDRRTFSRKLLQAYHGRIEKDRNNSQRKIRGIRLLKAPK